MAHTTSGHGSLEAMDIHGGMGELCAYRGSVAAPRASDHGLNFLSCSLLASIKKDSNAYQCLFTGLYCLGSLPDTRPLI